MNKIYRDGELLELWQIKAASGLCMIDDKDVEERVSGEHCACGHDQGEFDLLPKNDPMCKEGGKRYMICRKCGGYSHL